MKYLAYLLNLIWGILKYAALLAAAVLILLAIILASNYGDWTSVIRNGWRARQEAAAAIAATQNRDWTAAAAQAAGARQDFAAALDGLAAAQDNPAIKNIGLLSQQANDLSYLLQTGEILSSSLAQTVAVAGALDKIRTDAGVQDFNGLSAADKQRFLQLLYESEPELNGVKADLNLAILNLDQIHRFGWLWPADAEISAGREQLEQIAAQLTQISPLLKLLPALAGYPTDGRFLLILQNNDELRPSGGFIGDYGLLTMQDGVITSLTTDDSYHLDMPASLSDSWQLAPPAELPLRESTSGLLRLLVLL